MRNGTIKNAPLRVLLCAPYPPPFGGIASLTVSLCPGLRDLGVAVVVLSYCKKNSVEIVDGATIYRYNLRSQLWRMLLPANWSMWLLTLTTYRGRLLTFQQLISITLKTILADRIATRHRCNVVSFYQSDAALELLACKKLWGTLRGIALTVFGEIYDMPGFIKPRNILFSEVINSAEVVMASSTHCANSFRQIGVTRKIEVNYVGVNLARLNDDGTLRKTYRGQMNVADDVHVVLFLGRFVREMGLDSLIAIIPAIINRYGALVKFVLAGARGPLIRLAMDCQERFPGQVVVMNDVPFDLLPSLYAAADIVLAPSVDQHACMGVTIKEAMAASRAVIGSNSGGIPEAILDGQTGLIVPLATNGEVDEDAFLASVLSMLADPHRIQAMGRAARLRAIELFSEEATVRRTRDAFGRCLAAA